MTQIRDRTVTQEPTERSILDGEEMSRRPIRLLAAGQAPLVAKWMGWLRYLAEEQSSSEADPGP